MIGFVRPTDPNVLMCGDCVDSFDVELVRSPSGASCSICHRTLDSDYQDHHSWHREDSDPLPWLGKFEGSGDPSLCAYLYWLTLDGCCQDIGDVESFGWFGRTDNVPIPVSEDANGLPLTIPRSYIVGTDNRGFVWIESEGTESEIDALWTELEAAWERFSENDDEGDDA